MQYEWYQACQCYVCVECGIVLNTAHEVARGGGSGHMRLHEEEGLVT